MIAVLSRVTKYRRRAALVRQLAGESSHQDIRERLLLLAVAFERLADQVANWDKRLAVGD
jgi:hypothetical protein